MQKEPRIWANIKANLLPSVPGPMNDVVTHPGETPLWQPTVATSQDTGSSPLPLPPCHRAKGVVMFVFRAGNVIIMRNTHNVPFTLTEIVCRMLPILLEARQKYSPESSSETLVMRRALLKFSNLALSDGRSPPFLYHAMSGVGLVEGSSRRQRAHH